MVHLKRKNNKSETTGHVQSIIVYCDVISNSSRKITYRIGSSSKDKADWEDWLLLYFVERLVVAVRATLLQRLDVGFVAEDASPSGVENLPPGIVAADTSCVVAAAVEYADAAVVVADAVSVEPAYEDVEDAFDDAFVFQRGVDYRDHQGRHFGDRPRPLGAYNSRIRSAWTDVRSVWVCVPYEPYPNLVKSTYSPTYRPYSRALVVDNKRHFVCPFCRRVETLDKAYPVGHLP